VEETLDVQLEIPSQIQKIMGKEKKSMPIRSYAELKTFLLQ
jgi:threonine synthase